MEKVRRLHEDLGDLLQERRSNAAQLEYLRQHPLAGVLPQRHAARLQACERQQAWVDAQIEATRAAIERELVAA